jgi:hypothetical protein
MPSIQIEKLKSIGFGLLIAAMGAAIMLMVWLDPSGANAPIWVVQAAASTFLFAGLSAVAQALGWKVLANLLVLVVVYLLAAPGLWMLFDGQGANCSATIAFNDLAVGGGASSWVCRGVFGFGGLLTLGAALLFTWVTLSKRQRTDQNSPEAAEN